MQEAPGGGGSASAGAAAPKPFLRRGSGWEARVSAAREGRRYVPKGGPVKDYSKEEEVPVPRRRAAPSRLPRSPAKQAAGGLGRGPGTAGGGGYGGGAAAAAGAKRSQRVHQQQHQQHLPGTAARSARPALAAGPTVLAPHQAAAAAQPGAAAAGAANWARRLLQGRPAAAAAEQMAVGVQERAAAVQEVALEEFEALESQVLREVHTNTPLQHHSQQPSPAKKTSDGGSGGSGSQQRRAGAGLAAPALKPLLPSAGAPPAVAAVAAAPPLDVSSGAGGGTAAARLFSLSEEQELLDLEGNPEAVEDVFHSDGEGAAYGVFAQGSAAEAAAAGVSHPLARRAVSFGGAAARPRPASAAGGMQQQRRAPPVYYEDGDEEEAEMQAESSFVQELPLQPASTLVQKFFGRQLPLPAAPPSAAAPAAVAVQQYHQERQASAAEQEAVEQLQQEVVRLQEERARAARLRLELEEAAARMEQEKAAFEKRKLEDVARFEAERAEELRKLQRDRRVLEKQSRAILKMPTKQSKEEVAAVEALLAEERRSGRAREARHKLTVERLRQQVVELQERCSELREQVQYLEQQRLAQAWGAGSTAPDAAPVLAPGAEQHAAAELPAASTHTRRAGAAQSTPAAGHRGSGAGPSAQLPTPGRSKQPGGLPAVRVERAGSSGAGPARGSASSFTRQQQQRREGQGAAWGLQPSWEEPQAGAGQQDDEQEEDGEELIAEVQLSEDLIVWEEAQGLDGQAEIAQCSTSASLGAHCSGGAAAAAGAGGNWSAAAASLQAMDGGAARAGAGMPLWQTPAGLVPGGPAAGAAQGAAPPAPAPSVASKASSALARFTQLRDSLAQEEGLQSRLASHAASLQSSPTAPANGLGLGATAMQPASSASRSPPPAAQDDLRLLGRSLLAAGASQPAAGPTNGLPQCAQQAPAAAAAEVALPGSAGDAVVSEVRHPDGRWERLFASSLREQRFTNGSIKQQVPGGGTLTRFTNGDVKKVLPCGTVEYFYAEVSSWQVTHPSGVDVYFFPSGQVEAHHPGGVKEILFPDGSVRKVLPDGRELAISAAHLSQEIQLPQPTAGLAVAT